MALLALAPISVALAQTTPSACLVQGTLQARTTRPSPLDSVSFTLGDRKAKVCYSRPSVRGRMVFDSLVPFDKTWRTGANEPTMLHLPIAADVAGVKLSPGLYILRTIPRADEWTVILSTSPELDPGQMFNNLIDVGRGVAKPERLGVPVEKFTIRFVEGPSAGDLVLQWDRTRVRVPISF